MNHHHPIDAHPSTPFFLSLQDEAFELGSQWAKLYNHDSPSGQLIEQLMETSLLVNVVHNDFHEPEAIFKPFFKAGADYLASKNKITAAAINGH